MKEKCYTITRQKKNVKRWHDLNELQDTLHQRHSVSVLIICECHAFHKLVIAKKLCNVHKITNVEKKCKTPKGSITKINFYEYQQLFMYQEKKR